MVRSVALVNYMAPGDTNAVSNLQWQILEQLTQQSLDLYEQHQKVNAFVCGFSLIYNIR